jgi:flavin reductase (DIM6/NTAB) family NADH-FMN oxidoreductase RutF
VSETITPANFTYLLHPYSTFLLSCCDTEGKPNIITIAWLIPISNNPPLIGVSIRPTRFSYHLIKTIGEFVVNVAPYEIARQVLYCGRNSGSQVDKFAKTGLIMHPAKHVRPPIIRECMSYLECRLQQEYELGDHNLLIAEVLAAYAHEGILNDNGLYDLDRAHPLLHLGRDCFTTPKAQIIEPSLEMYK